MKTKTQSVKSLARQQNLMPNGIPRYVRCYDSGDYQGADNFTVCFTGKAGVERAPGYASEYSYRAMNSYPFHPQGIGQWGSTKWKHCDVNKWGFAPAMGRKCHIGKRIAFADLPKDCQTLVKQDYREIWRLS